MSAPAVCSGCQPSRQLLAVAFARQPSAEPLAVSRARRESRQRAAQRCREAAAPGDLDAIEAEPRLHLAQLVGEPLGNTPRLLPFLEVCAPDHEHVSLPVRLEV